jgi:hypothetical protein
MSARIVSQDSEIASEDRHLSVPHRAVGSEGIREHQGWTLLRAGKFVVDAGVVEFEEGHGVYRVPALLAAMARSMNWLAMPV